MSMTYRSKLVKIGNSRGIRIPRVILEQAEINDEIEMTVDGNQLIIQAAIHPRQGWATRFAAMAENGDDRLLDDNLPTQWDQEEWKW